MELGHQRRQLLFMALSDGTEEALLDTATSPAYAIVRISTVHKKVGDLLVSGTSQETCDIVIQWVLVLF
jgi:hypothetical protein